MSEHLTRKERLTVEIDPSDLTEFQHIVRLHRKYGAPNPVVSVDDLVSYILEAVADGSRRPGSWERQLLELMGLVADTDEY